MGDVPSSGLDPIGAKPPVDAASLVRDLEGLRRAEAFETVASDAFQRMAHRPDPVGTLPDLRADLSETGRGEVGQLARETVSDVQRPGAAPVAPQAEDAVQIDERLRGLYLDLTNYQVAWKIAQRTQQDISQLLRGS